MKKVMTGGLVALLLAALVGLLSMASIGSAAAPTTDQYNKPVLALSVSAPFNGVYLIHGGGAGYAEGSTPSGTLTFTCTRGTTCPSPRAWGPVPPVRADGAFPFINAQFSCPSNVKSAIATDTNGVKSNSVKGPC